MEINYDDKSHTYKLDGNVVRSVTEIASEICGIKPQFFQAAAAARGTDVHSELGRYYDPSCDFEAEDFTTELAPAIAKFLKREPNMLTEVMIYNLDLHYAGTADLIRVNDKVITDIVDFKSGHVNKKYCTVQLSLYKLALDYMGYDTSSARLRVISPAGITTIEPLSWKECWDMQKSELDPIDKDNIKAMEHRLKELEPYVKEYDAIQQKLRADLLEQLEIAGATTYTGDTFVATYVRPTTRVSLDTARLKAEKPDIFNAYSKETKVAGTIKIQMNKGNEND
jgi:hypothetical protein